MQKIQGWAHWCAWRRWSRTTLNCDWWTGSKSRPVLARKTSFHDIRTFWRISTNFEDYFVSNCHRQIGLPYVLCTVGTKNNWLTDWLTWLHNLAGTFFEDGLQKLVSPYDKCLNVDGNNVEKWCSYVCMYVTVQYNTVLLSILYFLIQPIGGWFWNCPRMYSRYSTCRHLHHMCIVDILVEFFLLSSHAYHASCYYQSFLFTNWSTGKLS